MVAVHMRDEDALDVLHLDAARAQGIDGVDAHIDEIISAVRFDQGAGAAAICLRHAVACTEKCDLHRV